MGTKRAPVFGARFKVGDGGKLVGSGEVGNRLSDAEIAPRERIGITSSPHGDNISSPRTDARKGQEVGPEPDGIRVVKIEVAIDHGLCNGRDGGRPPPRHSGFGVIAEADKGEWIRELMRKAERRRRERDAVPFCESRRHSRSAGNADLLADDHPHHRLESIPTSDNAETGTGGHKGSEKRIIRQMPVRRLHIVIEAKESTHPSNLVDDRFKSRQMCGETEVIGLTVVGGGEIKLDHAGVAANGHGPAIGRAGVVTHHE